MCKGPGAGRSRTRGKRRPGCLESKSDRERELRLEESIGSDHKGPRGHSEVLILIPMAMGSHRKILSRAVT